jgi:LmbE family N-acetylglucosaminyl deacetylase
MTELLKLLCVLAHPDDESLGLGGTLAKYAADGFETYLVTATRGERGWNGDEKDFPGLEALGKIREAELLAAARVLGLREVNFLDYLDGDLDQAHPAEAIRKIVQHVRRIRPQVVITFDSFGAYGHPDHIAIAQFTHAALVCAADASYADGGNHAPHRVSKLYYMAEPQSFIDAYQAIIGEIAMPVDGVIRHAVAWEEWAITTRIDTLAHWRTAWQAIQCHRSQLASFQAIVSVVGQRHTELLGAQNFYRAYSLVNGGRATERDLFEGLR